MVGLLAADVVTQATDRKETLYKLLHKPASSKVGLGPDNKTFNVSNTHGLLDAMASLSVQKEPQV